MASKFLYREADVPQELGTLHLVCARGSDELLGVLWGMGSGQKGLAADSPLRHAEFKQDMQKVGAGQAPILDAAATQISEYFAGKRRTFNLRYCLYGTTFQQAAWRSLLDIPYGEAISYKEQASRVGGAQKARAVGMANRRNALPVIIPCHRVIGADGSLTGYSGKGGLHIKEYLLDFERRTNPA